MEFHNSNPITDKRMFRIRVFASFFFGLTLVFLLPSIATSHTYLSSTGGDTTASVSASDSGGAISITASATFKKYTYTNHSLGRHDTTTDFTSGNLNVFKDGLFTQNIMPSHRDIEGLKPTFARISKGWVTTPFGSVIFPSGVISVTIVSVACTTSVPA